MIRVLIIDDQTPGFIDEMKRDILGSFDRTEVTALHINPVEELEKLPLNEFISSIKTTASEFWDVVIIDINLADVKQLKDDEKVQLPITIAQAFREKNHAATAILYSGTLSDHIENLLSGDLPSEAALKRIFRAEIQAFCSRRIIKDEVLSALDNPSWLLRIDRMLMKNRNLYVKPEEAKFKGRSFEVLAKSIRLQDREGQEFVQLVTEYGVSNFIELNS